ncbi:MAG: hypothetical protein JW846_11085 [Dehalococcoidia bacterium]|nr:hypothetical protein [Dehalococcoidia bacterium]
MLRRSAVIWGILGLIVALVIDFLVPEGIHVVMYGGFGLLAGGCSWALCNVKRVPQGLVVGVIVGILTGLLDGTMSAVAASEGTLHPEQFIVFKYLGTIALFGFMAALPWSLQSS